MNIQEERLNIISELIMLNTIQHLELDNIVDYECVEANDSFKTYISKIEITDAVFERGGEDVATHWDYCISGVARGFSRALTLSIIDKVEFDNSCKVITASAPWSIDSADILDDISSTDLVDINCKLIVYYPLKLFARIHDPNHFNLTEPMTLPMPLDDVKDATNSFITFCGTRYLNDLNKALAFSDKFALIRYQVFTTVERNDDNNGNTYTVVLKYDIGRINENYKVIKGVSV